MTMGWFLTIGFVAVAVMGALAAASLRFSFLAEPATDLMSNELSEQTRIAND